MMHICEGFGSKPKFSQRDQEAFTMLAQYQCCSLFASSSKIRVCIASVAGVHVRTCFEPKHTC